MTSPDHKLGQILKLIYLRQYWSYNIDQKLKMSEMLMAIFLVYSTSGITSGKKVRRAQNGGHFENFEILNTASIWPQIWKYRPKLCPKKFFLWWWRHRWRQRVASKFLSIFMLRRGWLREQIARAINANIIIVFLGYTCQKMISMNYTFRDCRSKVNISQAYWVTLALISNIANYLKYY